MSVHVGRELERELTAVTEQRDEWKAKFIQQNKDLGCEMMDPDGTIWDYAKKLQTELPAVTQQLTKANETIGTMIDEIGMLQLKDKATTEQRDEALSDLEFRRDLYSLQTKQLDDVREQRDRLLEQQEQWRLSSVCRELVEQRDRLAEALESIVGESAYEGLPESKQQAIEQALQSLNQNAQGHSTPTENL